MTKLPMGERIRYKKRILVTKFLRDRADCDYMWSVWNLGFKYMAMKYLASNKPTEPNPRDLLQRFSDSDCLQFLRFTRAQVLRLAHMLGVPKVVKTDCGFVVDGVCALTVLLYRLANPGTLNHLRLVFGLSASRISETFKFMLHWVNSKWGHLLKLDTDRIVHLLPEFAEAVYASGAPMTHVWGFVDGTVRPVARPTRHQRVMYNGHKGCHAFKFQGTVTPDGVIVGLHGPVEGARRDAHVYQLSGLGQLMQEHMNVDGQAYKVYGDPAYGVSQHLCTPYEATSAAALTAEMKDFNKRMSACRLSVGWAFREVSRLWSFCDYKPQQKCLLSPVATQYRVSVFLTNLHTCLNAGNQISDYFGVKPPTPEQYLGIQTQASGTLDELLGA